METRDLLVVADWLQRRPHVRRTGLIGYSWGANHCLLVAWAEGWGSTPAGVPPAVAERMGPLPRGRFYQAGVIALSPVLRFEELMDRLDTPQPFLLHPALAGLQNSVRRQMRRKGYANPGSGCLRDLVRYGLPDRPGAIEDSLCFVRLLPYADKPCDDKLARARVPVLIVHGANDPIAPAQTIADFIARTPNPDVAAILLPSGGHIGFGPWATDWYYSLIVSFFDPLAGPVAGREACLAQ